MKMHATRSLKGTPKFERSSNARKKVEMAQFCIFIQFAIAYSQLDSSHDRAWLACNWNYQDNSTTLSLYKIASLVLPHRSFVPTLDQC